MQRPRCAGSSSTTPAAVTRPSAAPPNGPCSGSGGRVPHAYNANRLMAVIDLLAFAMAVVICTAGSAAIAGHLLRPRPTDRLLLWFGLFSAIYGVRMFF